uniref:Uncharacterized protein n=1 Tax=Anopheles coluzzii TaxID=1518534 RepID=A0A6E8VP81_ANOCL
MIDPSAVVLLLAITLLRVETLRLNAFDVIKDCKQYNTALGYNGALNYIPISSFTHVVDQREFKY